LIRLPRVDTELDRNIDGLVELGDMNFLSVVNASVIG